MLSKVLRGDDAAIAEPVPWKQAANSKFSAAAKTPQQAPRPARQIENQPYSSHANASEAPAFEQKLREARESAYRDGEAAGRAQASGQIQPMLEQLGRSIQEIAVARQKLRAQAEGDLLKLALAIAKKVLHREITADPEALAGLIRVALDKVRVQDIIRVRVNAQHYAAVQQMVQRFTGGARTDVSSDATLPAGGVVVETARGEFDSSIDVQLKEIEKGLADRLASNS